MLKHLILLPLLFCVIALAAQPKIELVQHATGFVRPVDIAHCGDGRLFIVEQRGYIWVLDSAGNRLATPFLNIDPRVRSAGNEQGLLGLAFPPDFAQTGVFYVNYTREPDGATCVSRFALNPGTPNEANPDSEEILLTQAQPFNNHNGGCIKFGPDGYLYIALGDGGSGGDPQNHGQTTMSLLGKMLRIDVGSTSHGLPYAIPADNPFLGNPVIRHEIWSLGWRNPWRFAFDRLTGDLWVGDVGQGAREEIDFEPANTSGRNYGWRCYEGTANHNTTGCQPASAYIAPVFEYANPSLGRSVTGGFIYRGSKHLDLYGYYLFADYVSGRWWATRQQPNGSFSTVQLGQFAANQFVSFGEDRDGELYVAALIQGIIYRVNERCTPLQFSATITDATCYNALNGIIDLHLGGGTAPFSFNWNVDQPDSTVVNLNPGTYTVEVQDALGCIRRDTFEVGVVETPPAGLELIFDSGALSVSIGTWEVYQWLLNGQPIPGANSPTYTPIQDGLYACHLTSTNGCLYKIELPVVILSTALPATVTQFSITPNPTQGSVRVRLDLTAAEQVSLRLLDANQRQVFAKNLRGQQIAEELDLSTWPAGTYYLIVQLESGKMVRQVLRQ